MMFKDLLVVELASVLAGPAVGQFFAELGARVIKVENPRTGGDVTRSWKTHTEDPASDISAYFSCVNWGKQSIALDAKTPEGLRAIHALAAKADVVLASYKPGDAEKYRLDYSTLKQHNPKLIYAHISGFGLDDTRAGYDAIIQAEAGFTHMNGQPDGPPTKMPVALMDVLSAHHVKEALLLALLRRSMNGQGGFIHVSLLKSGVCSLANQAANWLVGGIIPGRMGSDHPNVVPYGTVYETQSGGLVLAVGNDAQFRSLCTIIDHPALADDPRFATNAARVQHRAALHDILAQAMHARDRDALLEALHAARVPAGAVKTMPEVMEQAAIQDLHIQGRFADGSPINGLRSIAFEADFLESDTPLSAPPHLDQHGAEIRRKYLGGE